MAATKERCRQVWTEGEDSPRCSGHGKTMYRNGSWWKCAVKTRARTLRRNHALAARGLCGQCGERPLRTNWRCVVCVEKQERYNKNKRKMRSSKGLCTECGKEPLYTMSFCGSCLERHKTSSRERYSSLSGFEYNKLLLKMRRNAGLQRRRARHERMALDG